MYLSYFGLSEAPFSIAPDPRYMYMTERHEEALAHLLYGVTGDGGFVLLTGEVGAGKTTVSRCLLEQIPESCDVAYVFNPRLTVQELLSTLCIELGIALPADNTSVKAFVDRINAYLLDANARGRRTVLIIDEAQNLSAEVLEEMRLLTNLETNQSKLLQIILVGQPELAEMLERPALRQLAQRIIARYHLGALSKAEVGAYVRHRLEVAGAQRPLFPPRLMARLYRLSKGVPRAVNVICDRALLGAYVQGKERVDRATLAQAAREVFGKRKAHGRGMFPAVSALLIVGAGSALALGAYQWRHWESGTVAVPGVSEKLVAAEATAAAPAAPVATSAGPAAEDASSREGADAPGWRPGIWGASSRGKANAALFQAWGADLEGGDACRQAKRAGLRCLTTRGSLDELRRINRPAVMHLHDEDGRAFHATLIRLDDKTATLAVGDDARSMPLALLATQWSGHYTVLWRLPPEAHENVRFGDRGPAVEWLSRQLEGGESETAAPSGVPVFDEALVRRVKQFQLAQGLIPDGIVGPQTLMRLAVAADPSAPKLTRGKGDK